MARAKVENSNVPSIRVTSIASYVQTVCRLRDEWIEGPNYFDPWFRGQANAGWSLEPSIFRHDLLNEEDDLRADFIRRAPQYMTEAMPEDYWGWYFLMQHYGAPTRLLDWTDSALVALFFALNGESKYPVDSEDAAVWMLNPWWLNKKVLNEESILLADFSDAQAYLAKPFKRINDEGETQVRPELPAAIDPPFIARRVAVQRSHFTIFGWSREGLTQLAQTPGAHLVKITIVKKTAARMRADLTTLGVTDATIFPELEGLAKELIRSKLGTWPPE